MKAYKFISEDYYYAFSGKDEQEAKMALFNMFGEMDIDKAEEIPESKWDKNFIEMHEDNDMELESFKVSIRDVMSGEMPVLLFTNDFSNF